MTLCNLLAGKEGDKFYMLASADRRGTTPLEATDDCTKLHKFTDNIAFVAAGTLGTIYDVYVQSKNLFERYATTSDKTVRGVGNFVHKALYEQIKSRTLNNEKKHPIGELECHLGVGGIDFSEGPTIVSGQANAFGFSDMAVWYDEPFLSIGSGSRNAIPTIKSWLKFIGYTKPTKYINMPLKDAINCLTLAHLDAAEKTYTVSGEDKIDMELIECENNKITPRKIDDLPYKEVNEELKLQKEIFKLHRQKPEALKAAIENLSQQKN